MKDFSSSLIASPSSMLASLESLFLKFNFRRLLFWIFIIFAIITGLIVFENVTGYAYFSRIERKVAILETLNNLSKDGISSNPELNPIYQDTVSELKTYQVEPLSFSMFFSNLRIAPLATSSRLGKFISGGFLGFMVAIAGLVEKRKGNEWSSTFWGGFVFGTVMGLIGIFIPDVINIWVNYIGFPILQIGFIMFFARKSKKK